ncbi:hypothetical protein A3E17_02400 [Candidatus Amesbacteria bacterium RIFCSPHIGHO2_12_FULL_48_14]|uniref:Uncharacterized protein n=3 Tax=Candidatus Amesiibacteriota TaxID=1752730 RepID=A0A1F4Z777_9BACT|nr:MAG: hypothetical protein UY22_C0020G0015 [Candidatus Amesbacteria bacterium GW2011_GWC1_48_10]KKU98636.1 MAG: hypothetical protein UY33_C0048G0014 [Candidatus Amesbacteria bacterium GW2011_GWA1_48_9]OGC91463.1 MAG: hypothetical protein A2V48_03395 [Candidatus Amesbacteria bacterium RBG_19FT_COMBO_48_16]OGD02219.1 MAG: hypothetical protein A3E17_02400 [Candidatus Amesbacteria bacterium RIFCSPHIGHO2_12_FULL_48_14]
MRHRGFAPLTILVVFLAIGATAGLAYYLGVSKRSPETPPAFPTPAISPKSACPLDAKVCPDGTSVGRAGSNCEFAPCPTPPPLTPTSLKPGWKEYRNTKYRFTISYPANFQALDDQENLYGWPNAVVLLYAGGQSYDLAVEVWNTKAEYEAKYKNAANLTVNEINGKFITLLNSNTKSEVDEIIATFAVVE